MQDSTDTTRLFGGSSMTLTVDAEGTAATVSDAGGIEHAHRPIVFGASLLWIECCSLLTTQCAISLRKKVLSPQASYSCCTCPLRRTEGWSCLGGVWRWQSFSLRGGKTQ